MAGARFSPEQLNVARGLLSAPQYRGAGPKVKLALGETGLTESNLSRDPTENSEGSAGPLQQTPKDGWGTLQQVTNPRYAAEAFLRKAIPLAGKYGTAGQLAQAVQRSAYPERYDQHSAEAAQLLAMLGGNSAPHAALTAMGAGAAPPQAQTEVPGPSAAQSADLTQLLQSLTQPHTSSSLAETPLTRPTTSGGPEQAAGTPRVPSPLTSAAAPASQLDAQLALVAKIGEDAAPEAPAAEGGISRESSPTTSGISQAAGKYVNPLPGFTKGRTDQGVDYSAKPGAPIKAIGNAKILGISPDWYKGQPFLDGPQKGKIVYVAEQINPSVKAGQEVKAGQQIGTYAQSGTGIETGFGAPGGRTQAQATTGYTEGQETQAGKQIRQLLERLGAR